MFGKLFPCLGVLALVGCSSDDSNEPAETTAAAIKGGTPDPTDSEVVGLFRQMIPIIGPGGADCGATLIAPSVALTARHCVQDFAGTGCSAKFTGSVYPHVWVSTAADSEAPGVLYKAASVQLPNADTELCDNDLALVILKAVIPSTEATPRAPLIGASVMPGDKFSAVGYGGVDSAGSDLGQRRRYDGAVAYCTGSNCGWSTQREWSGNAPLCPGDSGGPALDSAGRVSGVASRGDCAVAVYTRVECFADFLKSSVKAAATQAGYPAPAWTDQPSGAPSPNCDGASGTGGVGGVPSTGGSGGTSGSGATGGTATGGTAGSGATGGTATDGTAGSDPTGGTGNAANAAGAHQDAGPPTPAASGDSGSCALHSPSRADPTNAPVMLVQLLVALGLLRRRLDV